MTKVPFICLSIFLLATATSCTPGDGGNPDNASEPSIELVANATASLKIEGMTCTGCEAGVKGHVAKNTAARIESIDHTTGDATVAYDNTKTSADEIAAVITKAGWQASVVQ